MGQMSTVGGTTPLPGQIPLGASQGRRVSGHGRWVLSRLATRVAAKRRAFRSAVFGGALVAVSSAVTIAVLGTSRAADVTDVLALRTLAYASWLFGGMGLWAFCASPLSVASSGALAVERGFSEREVVESWTLGVWARIALGVFAVTLLPLGVSIALSPTSALLAARLLLVPGVALYAVLFGLCMALLARLGLALVPRAPRAAIALVVLLPFVVSFWFSDVPSVPGAFGWLIARLVGVGGLGL